MKKKITVALLLLAGGIAYQAASAQPLVNGLIPAGTTSLPQGKYLLTNLQSGQALYLEIDTTGKLLAQDPKAMLWTVTPSNPYSNTIQPISGTAPIVDPSASGKKPSVWGGLFKQGVESLLQNQAPNQTPQ